MTTEKPTRREVRELTFEGQDRPPMFEVWGLYPNGDWDVERVYSSRADADAYVATGADFAPSEA